MIKLHHMSIEVGDAERSAVFYERVFGFVPEMRMQWEGERIVFLTLGPVRLELVQPETFRRAESPMHLAFEVDDWDSIGDKLQLEGIRIDSEPIELDNGWKSVFVSGPDGELLEFLLTEGSGSIG